tara:strand:+ start:2580 stop:3722 length:1143 start_codon:yes stop_codon:yes gene_type:complete
MGSYLSTTEDSNNQQLTPFLESEWENNGDLHTQSNSKQLKNLIDAWSFSQNSNSKKTIFDEMLNSNTQIHCDRLRDFLNNNLNLEFKLENISCFADVVRYLDDFLKFVQSKIKENVDRKEVESSYEKEATKNVFHQYLLNLTDKQNICRLVLVRLSITDTYFKIMKIYQEKYSVGKFKKCKECLKQMIFLALSCKKDTLTEEGLSVLNIDKGLESSILDKINSFESHINSLSEFIGRFKELKTISRVRDDFYRDFLDCLQNLEMEKSNLEFPLFKIDLLLEGETDAKFRNNKSCLLKWTKQSESYFIYYVDKETTGDDFSKLTIITYFHSPNLFRMIDTPPLKDGEKTRKLRNYYGPKYILDILSKKGLPITNNKNKKIK